MKSTVKNILYGTITMLMLLGCSDDLLEETPPHIITAESLFTSLEGFETGINGLYALVREEREGRTPNKQDILRGSMILCGTDNMLGNFSGPWEQVTEDWANRNSPFVGEYQINFEWLYRIVNSANTVINRAENSDVDWRGAENKNRILAEARAMRAWAYRHLAYLWGDVPITVEESAGSNIKTDWQRDPVEEVWKLVKKDLLFSEKYIETEPSIQGRISKGAIQHYLSELYLVLDMPDSALYWANEVIDNPAYALITQRYGVRANEPGVVFMDMFYDGNSNREEGNTEALWVWQFELEKIGGGTNIMRRWHIGRYNDIRIGGVTPLEITVERGGRPRGRMGLSKYAIDLYESQDDRGSNYAIRKYFILQDASQNDTGVADELPAGYSYGDTIWMNWSNPITFPTRNRSDWPFSRKWDWANPNDVMGAGQWNDQPYLRLAETYLLKAEAQMLLGDNVGASETINVIRRRANASEISPGDVDIDFILDERSRELVVEEHRRYTLLRTGKWLERVQLYNTNGGQTASEREELFPIPQSVIDANLTSEMVQNPGY